MRLEIVKDGPMKRRGADDERPGMQGWFVREEEGHELERAIFDRVHEGCGFVAVALVEVCALIEEEADHADVVCDAGLVQGCGGGHVDVRIDVCSVGEEEGGCLVLAVGRGTG